MLALLNMALPALIALYKELRAGNPNEAAFTDAQMIDLLQSDSSQVEQKAKAWLASHPSTH